MDAGEPSPPSSVVYFPVSPPVFPWQKLETGGFACAGSSFATVGKSSSLQSCLWRSRGDLPKPSVFIA